MKKPIITAFALSMAIALTASESNTIKLIADAEKSLFWRTVSGAVTVNWNWPSGASTAEITASAGGKQICATEVSDVATTSATLSFATPDSQLTETAMSLKLVFKNGSGVEVKSETADAVGLVRGVDGAQTFLFASGDETPGWSEAETKTFVLPARDNTTALTAANKSVLPGTVPGWALVSARAGELALARTDAGGNWAAAINMLPKSFILYVR